VTRRLSELEVEHRKATSLLSPSPASREAAL
jgi:hypothetical protein